jgi:ribonuclease HII
MSETATPTLKLERALMDAGSPLVVGMDEVGRGAFGGPVTVGACAVDVHTSPPPAGLRDSKLLTAVAREKLLSPVTSWSVSIAVGDASAQEIDEVGIIGALRLAGMRALAGLNIVPNVVLLDGSHDWLTPPPANLFEAESDFDLKVVMKVKADMSCASVAAASIAAKVHRDNLMRAAESQYPGYGWATHVGYGTSTHREAIAKLGLTPLHRSSWKLIAED